MKKSALVHILYFLIKKAATINNLMEEQYYLAYRKIPLQPHD
ncbi:hypothetical protein [Microbulbifer sp. SSSA005]